MRAVCWASEMLQKYQVGLCNEGDSINWQKHPCVYGRHNALNYLMILKMKRELNHCKKEDQLKVLCQHKVFQKETEQRGGSVSYKLNFFLALRQ